MRVAATRLAAAPPPIRFLFLLVLLGSAIGAAMAGHVLGGVKENPAAANSAESDGLGRFAVDEHNKREVSDHSLSFLVPLVPFGCSVICFVPAMGIS
jgi:hypothetical protein